MNRPVETPMRLLTGFAIIGLLLASLGVYGVLAYFVALGVGASLVSGRLLQELLYQVRPGDPQVIAIIVAVLIGVSLLASWLPARRAASIDPMIALRDE